MGCRHKFTLCRLCLCKRESFVNIFQVNELLGYVAAEVITDLLQLQVSETDIYPNVVCTSCMRSLTDFKQFKKKCLESRDIYDVVLASEEIHAEHPISIEEERPVKLEPDVLLDIQESQQEVGNCSDSFTSQGHLAFHRKMTWSESYGSHKSSVNDDGKQLVAVEDVTSSGLATVKVENMEVEGRTDCDPVGEKIDVLPVEESGVERGESCVGEMLGRLEERKSADSSERTEEASFEVNERWLTFKCRDCNKEFEEMEALKRHLELHGYVINEECSSEGEFRVDTYDNERDTIKTRNDGPKKKTSDKVKCGERRWNFVCDTCGKGFRKIFNLVEHIRVHTGEKPFFCTLCLKRFSIKSSLVRHTLTHTGEKPFTCDVCKKGFMRKYHLMMHERIHSGERPYSCKVCNKSFIDKPILNRHFKKHLREKSLQHSLMNSIW